MGRPKKFVLPEIARKYFREDSAVLPTGQTIERGEMFKVKGKNSFGVGEWGLTFKFNHLVTNLSSGQVYVECFEMYRGRAGVMRAFTLDRIKPMPKKRRAKRVGNTASGTS
jgi:hypothetical protein